MRVKEVSARRAPESIREIVSRLVRGHRPLVKVNRRELAYWEEHGWTQSGNSYVGYYQTRYGSFKGMAIQRGAHYLRFTIEDPPQAIKEHSHWTCFIRRQGDIYEIHMGRMPADISSGIITIERLLTEAFEEQ